MKKPEWIDDEGDESSSETGTALLYVGIGFIFFCAICGWLIWKVIK